MIAHAISYPYRAAERRLSAYLRRYLSEHHESCADWVPDISEPMFRQLIQDGLSRTFAQYVFLLGILASPLVVRRAEENLISVTVIAIFGSVIFWLNWRKSATQCVDREFLYRRRHGKWRWEQ